MVTIFSALSSSSEVRMRCSNGLCGDGFFAGAGAGLPIALTADFFGFFAGLFATFFAGFFFAWAVFLAGALAFFFAAFRGGYPCIVRGSDLARPRRRHQGPGPAAG